MSAINKEEENAPEATTVAAVVAGADTSGGEEKDKGKDEEKKKKFHWPPLESNPEVFTDYMHKIGMSPAFAIGEVFSFDEELLSFLSQPIHGIIVALERLNRDQDKSKGDPDEDQHVTDFYMDQTGTLDNACGIIACIHTCLNKRDVVDILPDSVLDRFHVENLTTTPAERCRSLEGNAGFKEIHAGFADRGQSATIVEDQSKVKHHFVAFVVKHGKLVELDGTKKGPHVIGDCNDVLRGSIVEIQKRLAGGLISHQLSMMTLNAAG